MKKITILMALLAICIALYGGKISRIEKITKLESKIAQLEKQIRTLEISSSTNTYTKIYLRSLKINFLKSSFSLALLLRLFDKAEEILQALEKIEDKSKVQYLRRRLKIAQKRKNLASQ